MKEDLQVEYIPIDDIQLYYNNPRKNSEAVQYVANSIQQFGFKVPIIVDKDNMIICGHTRYKAARRLRMAKVPCIRAEDLTPEQVKAFRLADNKVAEMSGWDFDRLEMEFNDIDPTEFDLADFGFFPTFTEDVQDEEEEEDDNGGSSQPDSYALVIDCVSKAEQRDIYERLTKMNIMCRMA